MVKVVNLSIFWGFGGYTPLPPPFPVNARLKYAQLRGASRTSGELLGVENFTRNELFLASNGSTEEEECFEIFKNPSKILNGK